MRRTVRFLISASLLCLVAQSAKAEVCVILNADSSFKRLHLKTKPQRGIVWGKLSNSIPDDWCVNLFGDNGGVPLTSPDHPGRSGSDEFPDGPPVSNAVWTPDLLWNGGIAESFGAAPVSPAQAHSAHTSSSAAGNLVPVVVWSRFDGQDREIMYSFWNHQTNLWTHPTLVDAAPNDVDDVNPVLYKDADENLILVWERAGLGLFEARGHLVLDATFFDVLWDPPTRLGY